MLTLIRVFTGDERPSMMARQSTYSTLIDPTSLNQPVTQRLDPSNSSQGLTRRKTLLNFDEDNLAPPDLNKKSTAFGARASNVKSVFGTDHIWEREMTKLREIQAREREAAGLPAEPPANTEANSNVDPPEAPPRPQSQAPTILLPEIPKVSARKGPPPPRDDANDDEESDSDNSDAPRREHPRPKEIEGDVEWFSDEEKPTRPVRTVGTGPRYPPTTHKAKHIPAPPADDSDEDVPLAATVDKAVQRAAKATAEEESDEDKPLNALIDKTKSKLFLGVPGSKQLSKGGEDDEDEDDKPLGLRASQFNPQANRNRPVRSGGDEEDDVPLGLHPEQQRRTQYQMLAQQQQFAQQQMMMQAQLQSSLMFNQPSLMGSGFFGPPVAMGMGMPMGPVMGDMSMMAPPIAPGTPPPVQDPAKFGRVDAWRRDVAVEGEPA